MVRRAVAVLFAVGLLLLGVALDVLPHWAKLLCGVAAGVLIVVGVGLWAYHELTTRYTVVRREQLRPAAPSSTPAQEMAVSPQPPTRMPLIQEIEQHATRLRDMLDARFAERPGPKPSLTEFVTNREKYDAENAATENERAEHDRRTVAIYFEKFRTPGLPLFDEAVEQWWAGNPKFRPKVEHPSSVDDLRQVAECFRRLAHNMREKETDKAMEARGFRKVYVPVDELEEADAEVSPHLDVADRTDAIAPTAKKLGWDLSTDMKAKRIVLRRGDEKISAPIETDPEALITRLHMHDDEHQRRWRAAKDGGYPPSPPELPA